MAITGDLSQVDLPKAVKSGLREAIQVLDGVSGISFVRFDEDDVVRHPLVTRIVKAYNAFETSMGNPYGETH
jgi:phosphate starvation-inducible PhoH-like protein